MPTAVTVASLMTTVVSYASTGKGLADHGISIVLKKDCALLRGFEGDICLEPDPAAEFIASLDFATEPSMVSRPVGRVPEFWLEEVRYLSASADPAG